MVDKIASTSVMKPQEILPLHNFEEMERTQEKVNPYIPRTLLEGTDMKTRDVGPPMQLPKEIKEEVIGVVDKICEKTGHSSIARRLLEINERVANATDNHIFRRKEREHQKKEKIEGNVEEQKSWKTWQGGASLAGGFGTAFLALIGASMNNPVGQLLTQLSNFSRPAAESALKFMDVPLTSLHHDQSFFLNTVQSDKQAVEGLKRLPDELRQLVMELMRLELKAIESIAQRG